MSTAVKRACDACHRRKVKCDGINPCRNCSSAQLSCTYNAIPQKKGPKGSRAKVISELRENQRQSSLSAKIQNRMNGGASNIASFAPTQGLLTNDMIKTCIDFFFANMYPTMPILSRQRLEQDAMSLDTTLDTYCLLSSLCAFMMLQPGMSMPASDPYGPESIPGASIITATLLLEETLRVRKGYDYLLNPTLYTLATNYFLFACHYGLDLQDKAWCSLREATTLVHLVHMNKEETYQAWDKVDATRRRRLYWLLYAAERAYALQHDRPLSLKATVEPPTPTDDPSDPLANQLVGFCRLVSLFRPFDGAFVDTWNKTRSDCTPSFVATLQKQQNDTIGALTTADPQLSDVVRNQQWLQNLVWQVNIAKGNTSANATDMAAYQYSMMDVSREMIPIAASFSNQGSSDLLNSGLIESLLTITNDLTDVLSLMPSSGNPFTVSPRDHLHQLTGILAMLRIGEHRFAPLLLVKVHEVLPRLANPMLQSPPETACDIDIFDGFGNAGMVPQQYLPLDDFKADGSSSAGGAPSLQDVQSPFVSSPPILSPGMDFSHGMNPEFNPIADVVMQPQPSTSNCIPTLASGGVISHSQQQQQQSPSTQHAQQQAHITQQQQQRQSQVHHQQLSQQHQFPPRGSQHVASQHFQQQQPHQQHPPISMLQNLGNNLSLSTRIEGGLSPSQTVTMGGQQSMDQNQSIVGVLGSQVYVDSMNGLNTNLNPSNLAMHAQQQQQQQQQQQRSSGFGLNAQQLRTVGDFQALQRANSDMSSLGPIAMNGLGTELDFNTLR
ncbi:hypothetical protein SEUCBS140593_010032 [Sporothrix eucalyptigena]|uniref:Zn(2)-C6 fungal-type domain-containing protein n=1 Tax=Sporothrix eucalyptigena TaxID=1812306 RepID=A0ABP0CZU7_9PEZI